MNNILKKGISGLLLLGALFMLPQGADARAAAGHYVRTNAAQALERMGKSVPEDYSLVCFDYSDENPDKEGITCSITRSYEMGCQLGKRLMRMIENKDCDDKGYSYVMKPVIHEGTSIREL